MGAYRMSAEFLEISDKNRILLSKKSARMKRRIKFRGIG